MNILTVVTYYTDNMTWKKPLNFCLHPLEVAGLKFKLVDQVESTSICRVKVKKVDSCIYESFSKVNKSTAYLIEMTIFR